MVNGNFEVANMYIGYIKNNIKNNIVQVNDKDIWLSNQLLVGD